MKAGIRSTGAWLLGALVAALVTSLPAVPATAGEETSNKPADPDRAEELLRSIQRRFEGKIVLSRVDLWESRGEEGAADEMVEGMERPDPSRRLEVWTRSTAVDQVRSVIILFPEEEKGSAFRLHRWKENGEWLAERHIFLPSLDRLTRVKRGKQARLASRFGGMLTSSLMEFGGDFEVVDVKTIEDGDRACLLTMVTPAGGEMIAIVIEEGDDPVIRTVMQMEGLIKRVLLLTVEETGLTGGRRHEISGIVSGPGKERARFEVTETRLMDLEDPGPFSLEEFVLYAKMAAAEAAP